MDSIKELSKKQRFVGFLEKALVKSAESVYEKYKKKACCRNKSVTLKFVIHDVKFLRYITISANGYDFSKSSVSSNVDCLMSFDKAKTLHKLLSGKLLPLNYTLIGKISLVYKNQRSRILTSIYTPLKKNYQDISKGTRFTLNKTVRDQKLTSETIAE